MVSYSDLQIQNQKIGLNHPTYFVADIAANHDGDLSRARDLIYRAADAGADAAKFQHFKASTIVSDLAFQKMGAQLSHQASWTKSVYEVYNDASVSMDWNEYLKEACDDAGIHFFTTPYDLEIVDQVNNLVPAFKIGSGDITWSDMLGRVANKGKPYLLATGASELEEVIAAVETCLSINSSLVLMQCNTNYTASLQNFKYINLNVLKTYATLFPNVILGLSDHTPGHSTVLGAVSLGARVIEKHFTDDIERNGPDHKFSMCPLTWRDMVDRTRELEISLGSTLKKIEDNEADTVIVQRRSVCCKDNLPEGHIITLGDVTYLRPCPENAYKPSDVRKIIGKKLVHQKLKGDVIYPNDLDNL